MWKANRARIEAGRGRAGRGKAGLGKDRGRARLGRARLGTAGQGDQWSIRGLCDARHYGSVDIRMPDC